MKSIYIGILMGFVALPVNAQVTAVSVTADSSTRAESAESSSASSDSSTSARVVSEKDADPGGGEETTGGNAETTWKVEKGEKDTEDPTLDVTTQSSGEAGVEHDDIGVPEPEVETTAGYLKIEGIKGESDDTAGAEAGVRIDPDTTQAMNKSELIDALASAPGVEKKKPKEIVVVGSKLRETETSSPLLFQALIENQVSDDGEVVVENEEDLEVFVAATVVQDANIVDVRVVPDEVVMSYLQPVKLFGFIDMTITQTTSVNVSDPEAEDRVKVQMPWWHVFAKKLVPAAEVQATIEVELEAQAQIDPPSLELDAGPAETEVPTEDFAFNYEKVKVQSQTLQTMSNVSKMLHDTAMAIIRKIG